MFASIIIGVAISDQIVSLHRLLRSGVPVKWHWAQPWFALIVLLLNVMVWWGIVGEQAGAVTIGEFVPILGQLIILALLTIATLPDRVGPEGVDLAEFYQSNRRYQWGLLALALVWDIIFDVVDRIRDGVGHFDAIYQRSEEGIVLAVMIALVFARRWWLIAIGMVLLSMGPIQWLSRSIG